MRFRSEIVLCHGVPEIGSGDSVALRPRLRADLEEAVLDSDDSERADLVFVPGLERKLPDWILFWPV